MPRSSYGVAGRIQNQFQSPRINIYQKGVEDPFDFHCTFTSVNELFLTDIPSKGLRESDILCNYTGGPKPVSIGMVLASAGKRRLGYSKEGEEEFILEFTSPIEVREHTEGLNLA